MTGLLFHGVASPLLHGPNVRLLKPYKTQPLLLI